MDFSEYLDLADVDGPKLVGHRIWLFNVLYEHLYNHRRADQIIECYPTLSMEKVYACLLYYEQNKNACRTMIDEELERQERVRREDRAAHPGRYDSLRERLAAQRRAQ
jgi:uncharacterized protein (DUF433 family)